LWFRGSTRFKRFPPQVLYVDAIWCDNIRQPAQMCFKKVGRGANQDTLYTRPEWRSLIFFLMDSQVCPGTSVCDEPCICLNCLTTRGWPKEIPFEVWILCGFRCVIWHSKGLVGQWIRCTNSPRMEERVVWRCLDYRDERYESGSRFVCAYIVLYSM
jgi:hypothetical protein